MNNLLLEATRLTRASRLTEATAVIQRMLQGETGQLNASATQFAVGSILLMKSGVKTRTLKTDSCGDCKTSPTPFLITQS
jgi:hypothetical protein